MAQVEPLPLVPATMNTTGPAAGRPSRPATVATRSSPSTMDCGCRASCQRSQSSSGAAAAGARGRPSAGRSTLFGNAVRSGGREMRQQGQDRVDALAHLAAVDDEVDGAVLEQEFAGLEAFRQLLAHGRLDHVRTREADLG